MAVQISGNDITVPRDGTFSRNVSIAGTLTYEDVTNVDSIGLVTARNGIEVGASPGVAASISVDGNMIVSGISTFGGDVQVPDKIIHSGDTNTAIRFPAADTVSVETGGSERARVSSDGNLGIGTVTPSGLLHTHAASGTNRNYIEASAGNAFLRIKSGSTSNNSGLEFNSGSSNTANVTGLGAGGLQFEVGGSERLRIGTSGQLGIAGANYGTSGQVLQSQGSGSSVQWATPASGWVHAAEITLPTNASSYTFTGIPDGASHIRYLIRYMSFAGTAQAKVQLQKSTTGGSTSIISSNYISFSSYFYNAGNAGGANTDSVDLFDAYSNPANSFFGMVEIFRIGTNGSDGTNYLIQHFGVNHGGSNAESTFQSNAYIELGSSSTDFISGAKFYANTGENFDNGYINQSYLLS